MENNLKSEQGLLIKRSEQVEGEEEGRGGGGRDGCSSLLC